MKSFGMMVKLFLKTPQIILAYLMLMVVGNMEFMHLLQAFQKDYQEAGEMGTDAIYYLGDAGIICSVLFLFWVFIAFEYFRKSRESGIQENLDSMGGRGSVCCIQQAGVLMLAVLAVTANVGAYLAVGYATMNFPPILIEQMVKLLLVDIFLMSVASVFCGSLLSGVKNRFVGYGLILVLSVIMMWKLLEPIAGSLSSIGTVLYLIRRFICILSPDLLVSYDALYGIPYDAYRIAIMGIWIVAGSIWILRKMFIRRKKVCAAATGGCLIAIVVLGVAVWNRGSVLLQTDSPESAIFEASAAREELREKPADFVIRSYRMEMRVRNELTAECRIELADAQAGQPVQAAGVTGGTADGAGTAGSGKEYDFTLYYKYRIKKVCDAKGEEMEFRQEGNYVTVKAAGKEPVSELTFYYKGGSNLFYSNSHACFLPGIFPYYPKAGCQEVFCDNMDGYGLKPADDPEVMFDIGFDIPGEVVSNLEYKGGRYQGTADSALFVKGYLDYDYFKENHAVYYPMGRHSYRIVESYQNGGLQKEMNQLAEFLGTEPWELGQKPVVFIPNSTAFNSTVGDYYETDSYVLISGNTTAYNILKERMRQRGSSELQDVLCSLMPAEDTDPKEFVTWKEMGGEDEWYDKENELYDVVVEKMREIGVQEVARQVYARLDSEDYAGDMDSDLEFVKSMRKEA